MKAKSLGSSLSPGQALGGTQEENETRCSCREGMEACLFTSIEAGPSHSKDGALPAGGCA